MHIYHPTTLHNTTASNPQKLSKEGCTGVSQWHQPHGARGNVGFAVGLILLAQNHQGGRT